MLLDSRVKHFGLGRKRALKLSVEEESFTGLLDLVPDAAAAYSVARKLRAAYAGSAIRLREDAGQTEQDFGFTGANFETDVAAIAAWILAAGATNSYVVKLYDQSGNARDAAQGTAANQPLYVASVQNGKPGNRLDGIDDFLLLPDFLTTLTTGEILMCIKVAADPAAAQLNSGLWVLGSSGINSHFPWTNGTVYDDFGSTVRKTTGDAATPLNQFNIYNALSKSGEWTSRINNTQHFTTGTNTVGWSTSPNIGKTIGADAFISGDITEIILYGRDLSADRATVFGDIKDFYATP